VWRILGGHRERVTNLKYSNSLEKKTASRCRPGGGPETTAMAGKVRGVLEGGGHSPR